MAPKKVILQTVFAALFCLATAARAALQFDAFMGYDDLVPEQGWFPITCEVDNDGPPFNAVIEITARDFGPGQVRRFPLDLPTNTRKRIFIPLFATARTWEVRLLDASGKVRSETVLDRGRSVKNGLPLVAGLARVTAGLPVFPDFPPSYNSDAKYGAARLQPALFPDNPLALEGINLLYISSERAANLTVGQVNALVEWLQHGGHLILGVEQLTDVNATPWLRDLLPCELSSTVTLSSHAALDDWTKSVALPTSSSPSVTPPPSRGASSRVLNGSAPNRNQPLPSMQVVGLPSNEKQPWVDDDSFTSSPLSVATGSLRDGNYLIGDAAAPFVVEGLRGRGKITVLMFDPEREPFISWKNRKWLWAGLAGIRASEFQQPYANVNATRLSSDGIFGAMIDTKQVRKLPLGWLLALLATYLIVIGPLDQYWLKKINRQMLTWITFPCYVVIFSALIYYIGFRLRAGELEWNEVSVVDVLPDSDRAVLRGETYVSIYSPNNANYALAGEEKFAALRGESLGYLGGGQENTRAQIVQKGNNFEAQTYVPVWTSQLLVNDWVQPEPVPIKMSAKTSGESWTVELENKLDRNLSPCGVVLAGTYYDVGTLKAGEQKKLTFSRGENMGTSVDEMARQYIGAFHDAVNSRHNSFGNNSVAIPDIAKGTIAASFIGYINRDNQNNWENFSAPDALDLSRFAEKNYAIFLAWDANHSLTPAMNQFNPMRVRRDTLLRLVEPITQQ
ncbi:MAG TPA: hypothetical protein VGO67_01290 [Verrucomicrobiae bacterium]|jgi:hypothetical protein